MGQANLDMIPIRIKQTAQAPIFVSDKFPSRLTLWNVECSMSLSIRRAGRTEGRDVECAARRKRGVDLSL